jgi:hypothetical protein
MKENISRGLKRDQLFRVNASGRKQQQNSKQNKLESNNRREYKGKLVF